MQDLLIISFAFVGTAICLMLAWQVWHGAKQTAASRPPAIPTPILDPPPPRDGSTELLPPPAPHQDATEIIAPARETIRAAPPPKTAIMPRSVRPPVT